MNIIRSLKSNPQKHWGSELLSRIDKAIPIAFAKKTLEVYIPGASEPKEILSDIR